MGHRNTPTQVSFGDDRPFLFRRSKAKPKAMVERAFVKDPETNTEMNVSEAFALLDAGHFNKYTGPIVIGDEIHHYFTNDYPE